MALKRNFVILLLGGLVAVAVAVFTGTWAQVARPVATLVFPRDNDHLRAWPIDQTWAWTIHGLDARLDDRSELSLAIRSRKRVRRRTDSLTIPVVSEIIAPEESIKDYSPGGLLLDESFKFAEVSVTVQLIDLREASIVPDNHERPLRLLAHFGALSLRGENAIIEGKAFAGSNFNSQPRWENGELHLLNLYTQTDDAFILYDVVVEHKPFRR